jgi:outer membrane protein
MKNLPIILNVILFALVGHLYYLNSKNTKPAEGQVIMPAASKAGGLRIAYVNADTLDAKYEWLKTQKAAIEQRMSAAEKTLSSKEEGLMKEASALQEKFQQGNMTQAEAEKQQAVLMQRGQKLEEEKARLSKSLGEDQKKAFDDLYANVEAHLKTLSTQIGFDYILSYQRGGPILFASDSLEITTQVLDLLNAKK